MKVYNAKKIFDIGNLNEPLSKFKYESEKGHYGYLSEDGTAVELYNVYEAYVNANSISNINANIAIESVLSLANFLMYAGKVKAVLLNKQGKYISYTANELLKVDISDLEPNFVEKYSVDSFVNVLKVLHKDNPIIVFKQYADSVICASKVPIIFEDIYHDVYSESLNAKPLLEITKDKLIFKELTIDSIDFTGNPDKYLMSCYLKLSKKDTFKEEEKILEEINEEGNLVKSKYTLILIHLLKKEFELIN